MNRSGERRALGLLLVGSEVELGRSAAGALESRGFRVAHAVGSEQALTLIRDSPPQVAVVDVSGDGSVGLATLAKLRLVAPELPVIMLVDDVEAHVALYGMELGAADVLTKPADVDHLANRIRSIAAGDSAASREKSIAELMVPASAYQRVYEDESVQRVIEVLTQSLFHAAPGKVTEKGHRTVLVYSRKNSFLGCIRVNDLLGLVAPHSGKETYAPFEAGMFAARCKVMALGSVTAGEILGEQRFVDIEAPLMEAAQLMVVDSLINIPVLEHGELVGMLTDRNLLLEICDLAATGGGGRRRIRAARREAPRKAGAARARRAPEKARRTVHGR